VSPDLDKFRAKLIAGLEKASKGVGPVEIKLVANAAGFNILASKALTAQAALKNVPTYKIGLVADATGFNDSAREALKAYAVTHKAPTYKVKLIADGKSAMSNVGKGGGGGRRGGRGGGGGSEDDDDKALYRRVRDNLEKVEQAEDQAYVHRYRRTRSFLEDVGRAEDAAYRENARRDAGELKRARNSTEVFAAAHEQAIREDADRQAAATIRANSRVRSLREKLQQAESQGHLAELNRRQSITRTSDETIARAHEKAIAEDLLRDERAASARLRILERESRDAERSTRDRQRRTSRLTGKIGQDRYGPQLVNFGGAGIRPMNLLYGTVAAMTPALFAMAGSAVQASTSVAALGAAGFGAISGLSALFGAFGNITAAMKLADRSRLQSVRKTANDAITQRANARQIASGQRQIRDAVLAVADANRSLTDSQREVVNRQKDLNDARKEATRDLEDMRRAVAKLRDEESGAALDLQQANDDAATVNRNFFASDLERAQAAQKVKEAQDKLNDSIVERKRNTEDLAAAQRKGGVEGSDKVTNAKDALAKAQRDVADRQRDIAKAVQSVADARLELADSIAAQAGASDKLSAADSGLADRLARMSKQGRQFFTYLNGPGTDAIWNFQKRMEAATLPGFLSFLKKAGLTSKSNKTAFGIMSTSAAHMGKIMSNTASKAGDITKTGWFRGDLKKINKESEKSFGLLSKAALTLVRPLMTIFRVAAPLFTHFSAWIAKLADRFADFIVKQDRNGGLKKWFTDAGAAMGRWVGLGKQILRFVMPIFTISLPTGNNLVSRLTAFIKQGADWANKPEGAKAIGDFFDKIKKLPYGDIATFLGQLAATIGVFKGVRMGIKHPFVAMFSLLASMDLQLTATLLSKVTDAAITLLDWANNNKAAAATILGIFGALKVGKSVVDIGIKLPGIDTLKNFLTSRFSWLDKLLGGATTTVMNVKANIVNILGGGGLPGGLPAAAVGAGTAEAAFGTTIASVLGTTVVVAAIGAATVAGILWAEKHKNDTKDPKPNAVDLTNTPKGALSTAIGNEAIGFGNLQNFLRGKGQNGGVANLIRHDADPAAKLNAVRNNQQIQEYITVRKKSTAANFEYEKSTAGIATATWNQNIEVNKSKKALSDTLTSLGLSKKAADDYATSVFGTSQAFIDATGTAGPLNSKIGDLNTALDRATGKKVVTLTMADGSKLVFDSLKAALTYQTALQRGISLPAAEQRLKLEQEGTNNKGYVHGFTGGLVPGHSPHPKADNIHAMLTAKEFVQPVDAVNHYGVGFMEAVRTKRLPRFADGGSVSWPFPTDISKTMIPQSPLMGGGHLVGSAEVAAIAEATARAMGASEKQLIALIEAGIVESTMRNLSGGDRDSLGFLQQRPSQGWGTKKQIMNPAYATRKFILAAKAVDSPKFDAGQLAQRVQRSAYGYKYGLEFANAVAILNSIAPYVAGGGAFGNMAGGKGWQWQVAALAKDGFVFHPSKGQTTGGGHATNSWHYRGRAVDLSPPSMAAFNDIRSHWGATTKELIYGPAGLGIRNGQPYDWGEQNAKHMTHIHWAYGDGGLVKARSYDSGGILPPGLTLAVNNTGRNETVHTGGDGPMRLDRRDLEYLAQLVAGASNPTVHMDGRKVAEVTNRYAYLPAGV
jgi:hypothetical protein